MPDTERALARTGSDPRAGAGLTRACALLFAAALALAACGPLPPARPAPSGYTGINGGAEAYMHNAPRGTTNYPYQP